jgi:two-component system NtrC family sensor kinase
VYQSDKLATVGRLAAGVAHEINNPMASILTCAEGLLKMQSGIDHSTNEYLAIIRNSARRCKLITQKLLDYSAASDLRRETLDLHQILKEALTLLHFEASKKHIEIRISETVHFPPLQGSKDALVQVFVNLVLNGIQAVEEGGKIEICPSIEDDLLTVTINDNGSGISPENRSKVFEPFFTTKPIGSGTGLGLSVSQGIIRRHSGHIEIVESRPGRTSIKVSLPVIFEEGSIFDQ